MKIYKLRNQTGGEVINNTINLTENDMDKIYKSITLKSIDEGNFTNANNDLVKSTYGEMTYPAVQDLIKIVKFQPEDVFVDLGSGNGKVVMQIFANSNVGKAYGVEFYPERSLNSEHALKKMYQMKKNLLDNDRIISYQLGNIKDLHYLNDVSVFFACSTCFPEELLDIVYDKIKDSKKIRTFITHKSHDKFKNILPNHTTTCFPCTWSKNLTWHIYSK